MTTPSNGLPPDASPFYIDNDEETFSLLVQAKVDVKEPLSLLFERLRQDPLRTSAWTQWTEQCRQHGITVPSIPLFQTEKPQVSQPLPKSFETPAGKAHLNAIQAVLEIEPVTAVQVTLSCMRDVPSQPGQHVYGSHALLEKILDYAYRQRLVRYRVVAEALRVERDLGHGHREDCVKLLDAMDLKAGNRGLFMLLLLTVGWDDTELTREQYLPAKELWVHSADETRDEATKEADWRALCHRIHARQQDFVLRARREALEALVVLLYGRMSATRADFAMLLTALGNHDFFTSPEFDPRMELLAGLVCVEACELCRTAPGSDAKDWVKDHLLLQEADPSAVIEKNALLRLLQVAIHSPNNRPQGLAALSFGCLLSMAGSKDGYNLANSAIEKCQADVFLEETMAILVRPPSMEKETIAPDWFEKSQWKTDVETDKIMENEAAQTELTAPCLLYASVGRELLAALISTFRELLLDPTRTSHANNMNVMASFIQAVHRNSTELCLSTWGEWEENASVQSPFCQVIFLSRDLARSALRTAGRQTNPEPLAFLEACAPILKLAGSLVNDSIAVCSVMGSILPSSLLFACFRAFDSASTDPTKMETLRTDILQSISLLVSVACTDRSREMIRISLQQGDGDVGPDYMFHMAHRSGSTETLRLVTTIVAGLLPGAPPHWFLQATYGMDVVHRETTGGIFGREKSSTEALVDLTHALVLHMNTIFFSQSVSEETVISGLNALTNALSSIAHVLISSTSTLSGSLFGGEPLPYRIASKILMTLGNAFILLRPVWFTHPSNKVKSTVLGIIDIIVVETTKKTGIGGSALFFATLPAALGLAYEMYEIARDVELARAVRVNRKPGRISSSAAKTTNLNAALAARLDDPIGIYADLYAMETDGWLGEESADDVRQVSASAFRLLLAMFEYVKFERADSSNLNSFEVFVSEASPSLCIRRFSDLQDAWSASRVTYAHLLLRQMNLKDDETLTSLASFSLFDIFVEQSSQDLTWMLRSQALFRSVFDRAFEVLRKQRESPAGESVSSSHTEYAAACVRTLTKFLELNIDVVDPKQESENWNLIVHFVGTCAKKGTTISVEEVRLCNECLQCLLTLRKRQISRKEHNYFSADDTFLSLIVSIQFGEFSDMPSNFSENWSNSFTLEQSYAMPLLTSCLGYLTFEIQRSVDKSTYTPILRTLESRRGLLAWMTDALTLKSLDEFMAMTLFYYENIHAATGLEQDVLPDLIDLFGQQHCVSAGEALSFWLGSLCVTDRAWGDFAEKLYRLRVLYVYFRQELAFAEASQRLSMILSRDRQQLVGLPQGFPTLMSDAVIKSLDKSMESLAATAGEVPLYGLVDGVPSILEKYPLIIAELSSENGWTQASALKLLGSLRENAYRAMSHLGGQRKVSLAGGI